MAAKRTVLVNDVTTDPRYLTTSAATLTETIVPVVDPAGGAVVETLDVESPERDATTAADRQALERYTAAITVVQESVSMLYRDQGAGWVDEQAPVDRYPTARGNLAAEANAHRFSQAGETGIVVRSGWVYGPAAAGFHAARALFRPTMGLDGEVVLINPTDYFLSTALGRTIRYVDVPVQATRAARHARGVFEQLRGSAEALAAGEVTHVTDMVAHVTGGPPRTLAAAAHDLMASA